MLLAADDPVAIALTTAIHEACLTLPRRSCWE